MARQAENSKGTGAYNGMLKRSVGISPGDTDTVKFISRYLSSSNIPIYFGEFRDNAIRDWLLEYHSSDTPPERKIFCRDCILLNVYFLFPYLLRTHYTMRASLFEDALQNMVISVLTAIDRFDVSRGSKFTSYIPGYLKEAIEAALINDGVVRIPRHIRKETAEALAQPLTEEDLLEDDSEASGDEEQDVQGCASAESDTEEELTGSSKAAAWTMNPNGDDVLEMECLNSGETPALDDLVDRRRVIQMLEFLLSPDCTVLNEKEKVVITYRFGVFGTPKLTLTQVSDLFRSFGWNGTMEWVFQLQRKSLEKVRVFFDRVGVESPFG